MGREYKFYFSESQQHVANVVYSKFNNKCEVYFNNRWNLYTECIQSFTNNVSNWDDAFLICEGCFPTRIDGILQGGLKSERYIKIEEILR